MPLKSSSFFFFFEVKIEGSFNLSEEALLKMTVKFFLNLCEGNIQRDSHHKSGKEIYPCAVECNIKLNIKALSIIYNLYHAGVMIYIYY